VRASRTLATAAAVTLIAVGCARAPLVLPVQIDAKTLAGARPGRLVGYESAVQAIAAVMVGELGVPLPRQFTVFVYPTRSEYEQGLARQGTLSPARAAEIAEHSVGLGQHLRLFVNDEALLPELRVERLVRVHRSAPSRARPSARGSCGG